MSIRGLLRELNSFYDVEIENEIYSGDIKTLNFDFQNNVKDFCPKISFLKVEIDEIPNDYCDIVEAYFKELDIKKIIFSLICLTILTMRLVNPHIVMIIT